MGNKMCVSRHRPVADRFTRPQRLHRQPSDVDYKKLKKLIRSRKLAPCFDAVDDPQLGAGDLEECPICFLYYPSLNRSRCCAKGICTECFLQMKPSHTSRTAQCPFCKASCYAVEFHGARTEEEKSLEHAEEQKYIEAKIRMQSESQIEDKFMPGNPTLTLVEVLHTPPDIEEPSNEQTEERNIAQLESSEVQECTDICGISSPIMYWSRHQEFGADLEEIMVMEATWKSLQDSKSQMYESSEIRSHSRSENLLDTACFPGGCGEKSLSLSLSEGVAVSIARLAEHSTMQQTACEPEWELNVTDQSPHRNFVCQSNRTRLETGHSSGSCLHITEQPCMLATTTNA